VNQDDETDLEIGNDKSESTGESTLSSDIKEDNFDDQQEVLHQSQACRDKS
jgi:hypothetical protein